jgi:hypothetical protein
MSTPGFLLVDANVLVDYQAAGLAILSLVSRHIGMVHIVSTVLAVRWGLELMLELVQGGHLTAEDADQAAERSHRANPVFSNRTILAEFRKKLAALG